MSKPLEYHEKYQGKIAIQLKSPLETQEDLGLAYSPGVAEPCKEIQKNEQEVFKYTAKGNTVAVISDGSAVLGLGNIGPLAGIPVMEGKAALFKKFADIDAIPLCLDTQDPEEIISIVQNLEPSLGGVNLEDISAPRCFQIEQELKRTLGIPVFHDDQHGTAIVTLAGLINAVQLAGKSIETSKIVVMGAGAAGTAIVHLLLTYGAQDIVVVNSKGTITKDTVLDDYRTEIFKHTNQENLDTDLAGAMEGADIFIGVSVANIVTQEMIHSMNEKPIIFAMANPDPEITPAEAEEAGAFIVATGRSDYPNQVNNLLAFPGIFRGALDGQIVQITDEMKVAAAEAIAQYNTNPTVNEIIPSALDKQVTMAVAEAVKKVGAGI